MKREVRELRRTRSAQWQTVNSSDVHSALYNDDTGNFYIRFLRGGADAIYIYPDRTLSEWEDFRTATSKGGWVHENPLAEGWTHERLTTRDFTDLARDEIAPNTRRFLE